MRHIDGRRYAAASLHECAFLIIDPRLGDVTYQSSRLEGENVSWVPD